MKKLTDIDLSGKRVLMRVDFNVPIKEGKILDETRIVSVLPSINYVLEKGGKLILMSHLGRPKGKHVSELSLKPVAEKLSEIINKPVKFAPCCRGKEVEDMVNSLLPGEVMLLENTRFHPEEEKNDKNYAEDLAKLCEVYINEAFSASHRAHASVEGIAHYVKEKCCGLLFEKELKYLSQLIENPGKPYFAIMGGAKVSDKIDIMKNLLPKVDKILLGGGMVFTFLKAKGYEIGKSIVEEDKIVVCKELLDNYGNKIELIKDVVIGDNFSNDAEIKEVNVDEIPFDWIGLDIGKNTVKYYCELLSDAKTIFWNGPMGVFEFDNFSNGTKAIAEKLAKLTEKGTTTIVGGGDTISALNKFNLKEKMTFVSTGGGATLEFLAGIELPGIKALED